MWLSSAVSRICAIASGPCTTVNGTCGWTVRPSGIARRLKPAKLPFARSQARKSGAKTGVPPLPRCAASRAMSASPKRAWAIQARWGPSPALMQ